MSVLLFIVILLVLIIGHELGHFFAAKWSGMKVPEFGIGFPPRLWGTKIGDTEYTINALPFGGFVRIVGEDGENADHPDSFGRKSWWLQALTLVAGPGMNVVLGFLAFWIALSIGIPAVVTDDSTELRDARVVVVRVLEDSPAGAAGLEIGDKLVSITRGSAVTPITKASDVPAAIAFSNEPLTLTYERSGVVEQKEITPVTGLVPEEPTRFGIGIASAMLGMQVLDPLTALGEAAVQTVTALWQILVGLLTLLGNAFTLSASLEDVSGPVGIAGLVGDASVFGAGQVLVLAAIISLNLAIINLLPLPALDGGRLALLAIETWRRKAVPQTIVQLINAGGFLALILLMVLVTWHDISRLIG
ncbi:MAG: site-2 protease family protein [Patescibacteria group bacterium]